MRAYFTRVKGYFKQLRRKQAVKLPRAKHNISRKDISPNAVKVLYRLNKAGYDAYLVGGGVRDLLLGRRPKDFDIVTNATPNQIKRVVPNSRIIGRRFKLVHAYFRHEIIEVSTFRAKVEHKPSHKGDMPSMVIRDNTFGSMSDDAFRRDFTVNALFYDISDFSVVDYTGGLVDLERHTIRVIGDPTVSFHEDPVRMLRAIRLAAKLNFTIEPKTEAAMLASLSLLDQVPQARLFDELQKIFFNGYAKVTFDLLRHYQVFGVFFPHVKTILNARDKEAAQATALIDIALKASDSRFKNDQPINPGFLLAVFLWPEVQAHVARQNVEHKKVFQALHNAIHDTLKEQTAVFLIPKRFTAMMQAIWLLQYHLEKRRGLRVMRIVNHRYYRAAYDFLLLRSKVGMADPALVEWWDDFYLAQEDRRLEMVDELAATQKSAKRRKRPSKKRKKEP